MEIVCLSYSFPPYNEAEALCTARLVSALAAHGVNVHVVTADHAPTLEASICGELVDGRVSVTRVPVPRAAAWRWSASRMRRLVHAPHIEWVGAAVTATRAALRRAPGAVLLTRSMPVVSNLAGYYCRDLTACWVAHFSDPYPIAEWLHRGRLSFLARPLHGRWARRIVRSASLVTVTCRNAVRYMQEKLGTAFEEKTHVLPHLALPALNRGGFHLERKQDEFWLAHVGNLMAQRNPGPLLRGLAEAGARIPELRFLQYGNVDEEVLRELPPGLAGKTVRIEHQENLSPRDAADLQAQVDVNVIVDTDFGLSYSPLLLSKYPHAVCSGRPLLMLSQPEGAMSDYTARWGGGVLASSRDPQAIAAAIGRLHDAWRRGDCSGFPSPGLMNEFAPETLIPPFLRRVEDAVHRAAVLA